MQKFLSLPPENVAEVEDFVDFLGVRNSERGLVRAVSAVSVFENAPEWAGEVPAEEWQMAEDAERIVAKLEESARRVRDAVQGRIVAGRGLDCDFAHPIQLIQFLIFHDGYHHGQIKLALKAAGCPISDAEAGPRIWDVWRAR